MHIEVSTTNNIDGSDNLTNHIQDLVKNALVHFGYQITRVEVHLSDANASKSGQDDKHCMMEARLEGSKPLAVNHAAATLHQAAKGAADKLKKSLESDLGKRFDQRKAPVKLPTNRMTDLSVKTESANAANANGITDK